MRRMKSSAASTMPAWIATVRSTSTVSRKVVRSTSHVAARHAEELHEVPPLAHVVGDDEQDAGQRRHRDPGGPVGEEEHDREQRRRVDDAGDRRATAAADVGRGARDRAGRRECRRRAARRDSRRPARPAPCSAGAACRSCRPPRRRRAATRSPPAARSRSRVPRARARGSTRGSGSTASAVRAARRRSGVSIVSTGSDASCTTSVAATSATSGPGTRCVTRGQSCTIASEPARDRAPPSGFHVAKCSRVGRDLLEELGRHALHAQPEEVAAPARRR